MLLTARPEWAVVLVSLVLCVLLTVAYWRGFSWAAYVNVALLTLSTALGIQEPFLTGEFSPAVLAVPVLILILSDWRWMLGSAAVLYGILLVRAGWASPYGAPGTLAITATAVGGLVIARLITETAQRRAEISAAEAAEAAQRAEHNAQTVEAANELLNEQLNEQQRLLDLVLTLETPAVTVAQGVLLAPLIGHLDSRRAELVTERLLAAVRDRRIALLILDITGVTVVDTGVAAALIQMVNAVRLLGCRVTLTGISASVATSITTLGLDLKQIETARSPEEALQSFLQQRAAGQPADRATR
jgi:anti-anti-sigma regulatory factor